MSRTLRAMMIVMLVASCGGGRDSGPPPGNLDDACAIVAERPHYLRAFRATERRWGVPVHVQMATIHQESKFDGGARTPFRWTLGVIPMGRQSSAYGYSQALDGTWDEYKEENRRFTARRNDIHDATDFMGWYMAKSNQRLGISMSDARNQYLAYHEGRTGFSRGSYNAKPWLLRVSAKVEERARMYETQLRSCGGRRGFF
ncbi:lytic transglycosylase [Roseovarius sp. MMSF_3281]|uniref:transglycosylase SLT domain-containing protein n=1 Tax=Roseovarius sp. MMSF_3281 TaxID=3046694 RepID=UPI00273E6573|nr:lytic transglycosylase [Roseovarius sp. MMSF_3281]